MKKFLYYLGVIVIGSLIFIGTPATVKADVDGDYTYTVLGDTTAQITAYSGAGGDITIPNTLGGHVVSSIGNNVFQNKTALTGAVIPASVTSIGDSAFYGTGLTSIIIPDGVTSIGNFVFKNSTQLASVTIGNGVANINTYAFQNCTALSSVTIGSGVTTISDGAFYNCPALVSITIPSNVTTIGVTPFSLCVGLTEIIVAASNPSYSSTDGVLFNKAQTSLISYPANKPATDYVIPASVTSIENSAFASIQNPTSVVIPDTVTSMGASAFNSAVGLTSVTIGSGLTSIGNYTFQDCTRLASITIPENITDIGISAFQNSGLTSVNIPSGVTSLGTSVFLGCTKLTSITIPDTVTSIGVSTFSGCSGLTSVTISSNVTTIGNNAFLNCSKLTGVTIPASVSSIGNTAFKGNSKLAAAYFLGNAPTMGTTVFQGAASGFKVYYISGHTGFTNPWNTYTTVAAASLDAAMVAADKSAFVDTSIKGTNTNLSSIKVGLVNPLPSLGTISGSSITWVSNTPSVVSNDGQTVVRPDYGSSNVTVVMTATFTKGAVTDTKAITLTVLANTLDFSYTITDGAVQITGYIAAGGPAIIPGTLEGYPVTSIADYALSNVNITSLVIPDSVTSIGAGAFQNSLLTSVNIPSGVTEIGIEVFSGCTNLTSITIPNGVTSIGVAAFSNSGLTSITIPDSVTSIGANAFSGSVDLVSVAIGSGLTNISDNMFYACSSLTSITIPDTITSINSSAFASSGLTSITIPANVSSLGDYVFNSCADLTAINVDSSNTSYSSETGVLFNKDKTILIAYPGKKSGAYVIPNSVTSISSNAFQGSSLTSITIPDSVTSIGASIFQGSAALTSVSFGSGLTSIGDTMFGRCSALTSITIPNTITSIGAFAFLESGLTSITIPDSVTDIGYSAFDSCAGLVSVIIGKGLTSIGDNVFPNCTALTSVTIPNNITSIGPLSFQNSGLASITIPASVTQIIDSSFVNSLNLASAYFLGDAVTMGNGIFDGSAASFTLYHFSDKTGFDGAWNTYTTSTVMPDSAVVAADKDSLTSSAIKGSNFDLSNIATTLNNPLPSSGGEGSGITWISDTPSVVSNNGQTINRPAYGSSNATVIMTATISQGAVTDTKAFTLTVLALPNPDIAFVASDKAALTDNMIKGSNSDLSNVVAVLANPLPSSGANGSTITWVSDTPSVISNDGQTISRPAYGLSNANVTMAATITKGVITDTKAFSLTVLALPNPDIALVASDKSDLVDNSIKGSNSSLSSVTLALANPLPSSGANGSSITWTSSNPSIISNDGQTIIRPTYASGDANVTMTATIAKGAVTDTKAFALTVIKLPAENNNTGGTPVSSAPIGNGLSSVIIGMSQSGTLGTITAQGTNLLTYINSNASFNITTSSANAPETHSLTVSNLDLSNNIIQLTIQSVPQIFNLKLGQTIQVDLNGDKIKDIEIKFADIWVNRAELTIRSLLGIKDVSAENVGTGTGTITPVPVAIPANQPKYLFKRNLTSGMTGADVKELQKYLNANGFIVSKSGAGSLGKETSYFGAATRSALIRFQKAHKISPAVGYFGPVTRKAIGK